MKNNIEIQDKGNYQRITIDCPDGTRFYIIAKENAISVNVVSEMKQTIVLPRASNEVLITVIPDGTIKV